MATSLRRLAVAFFLLGLVAGTASAQDASGSSGFSFNLNAGVGIQSFPDELDSQGNPINYQSLAVTPDFSIGPFGMGMILTLDYRFTGTNNSFAVRTQDLWPDDPTVESVATLYLAKIMYIRWGQPTDPLYLKFGSFDDGTLGDGFIIGDYNNTLFLPMDRHFGLEATLDGSLFKFPYVGMQAMVGNFGAMDVMGGRLYTRPLISTEIPILKNLEVGLTAAVDTDPYLNTPSEQAVKDDIIDAASPVAAFGGDVSVPLVYVKDVVNLLAYTDVAMLQGERWGGMAGLGGSIINCITYGAQIRAIGENFIPDYFGPTYDLYRDAEYQIITSNTTYADAMVGWLASIGTSFFDSKLVFRVSLDGPFAPSPDTDPILRYPHLSGIFSIAEGVIPSLSFDFTYDKRAIDSFASLVSAKNAAIQAKVNFSSGPATISLVYDIVYDPAKGGSSPWDVTSGLQSSISFF